MGVLNRLRRGWNVFKNSERQSDTPPTSYGSLISYGSSPNRTRMIVSGERSLISSIYNRIAIDVAELRLKHVEINKNGSYTGTIDSDLNKCLSIEANLDQSATAFKLDMVMTLLEQGVIAVVPVNTSANPNRTGSYDIYDLRVGTIVSWYPEHVTVNLYDQRIGQRKEVTVPKRTTAIIENPLFSVMNEPNSTYQRLVRKLNLLDVIDEQTSSGKLDIIIQLPYTIKNQTKLDQAKARADNIETQLKNSKYGVAYIDGTEKITQLNRPAENNMLAQVEYLTTMLYGQLGITEEILNGTATEEVMVNYHNRTLKPIIRAISESMERTFLTKTARTQGQAIRFYSNPLEMIPPTRLADMADKLTRNEILSSNEVRALLALEPSDDPRADELINKNMPLTDGMGMEEKMVDEESAELEALEEEETELDEQIEELERELGYR